jgi:hypothetical protein
MKWDFTVDGERAVVFKDGVKQWDSNAFGPVPQPVQPPVLVAPPVVNVPNTSYPPLTQNYKHEVPLDALRVYALPLKSRGVIQLTGKPPTSGNVTYQASISRTPGDFGGQAPYSQVFGVESGGFVIMPVASPYYEACVVPEYEQWYFNIRPIAGTGILFAFYG